MPRLSSHCESQLCNMDCGSVPCVRPIPSGRVGMRGCPRCEIWRKIAVLIPNGPIARANALPDESALPPQKMRRASSREPRFGLSPCRVSRVRQGIGLRAARSVPMLSASASILVASFARVSSSFGTNGRFSCNCVERRDDIFVSRKVHIGSKGLSKRRGLHVDRQRGEAGRRMLLVEPRAAPSTPSTSVLGSDSTPA